MAESRGWFGQGEVLGSQQSEKKSSCFLERNLRGWGGEQKGDSYGFCTHVLISSSKGDPVHIMLLNPFAAYVSLYCFLHICYTLPGILVITVFAPQLNLGSSTPKK